MNALAQTFNDQLKTSPLQVYHPAYVYCIYVLLTSGNEIQDFAAQYRSSTSSDCQRFEGSCIIQK